ncbi:TIGR00304 family membrane protein [Methanosarcina sp. T3]|uniref:TIGR00304 family membrane protein n=1 Tax=Methanosarcina sp. T3 TaxID=3439062 RepID=UPI003F83B61A
MLIIGTAIGMRANSEPGNKYSNRRDRFGNETDVGDSFGFEGPDKKATHAEKAEARIKGGGVIMLGPIPIVFGSDGESAKTAMILAIILMVLSLLIFRGIIF